MNLLFFYFSPLIKQISCFINKQYLCLTIYYLIFSKIDSVPKPNFSNS